MQREGTATTIIEHAGRGNRDFGYPLTRVDVLGSRETAEREDWRVAQDCLERARIHSGLERRLHVRRGHRALRRACQQFIDTHLIEGAVGRPSDEVGLSDLPELLVSQPIVSEINALLRDILSVLDEALDAVSTVHEDVSLEELRRFIDWYQEIECSWVLETGALQTLESEVRLAI